MTTELIDTDGTPIEHGFEVLLTPRDAAAILAVSTRTLSKYANMGRLRYSKTEGGHRRYPADAIRAASRGEWDIAGATERPVEDMSPADVYVAVE